MAADVHQRRKTARKIFTSGVESVLPHRLIADTVSLDNDTLLVNDAVYHLQPGRKVYVFGSGKASAGMAESLLSILQERTAGGVIVTNQVTENNLSPLTVVQGSHPVPDENSVRAAELLLQGMSELKQDDFFFYLLSGGSSALVEKPIQGISLDEMQETTNLLLTHGVPIQEINAVRKHLSMVKGGRLGQCTPASGVVLVVSDVIGDDLSVIGSGPLYFDPTTFGECRDILGRAAIWDKLAPAVRLVIEAGEKGDSPETPKIQADSIHHFLIGTNRIALEGAHRKAEECGLNSHILSSSLAGEAREVAKVLVSMARNVFNTEEPFQQPCCLLFGGETTVTIRGSGKGGRNQEFVLAALAAMNPDDDILVLSGGTDGIDGNSTAAGALADLSLLHEAIGMGLSVNDFLADNNSNEFFRQTGGLLETGPTGTNVMDITLLLIDKEAI